MSLNYSMIMAQSAEDFLAFQNFPSIHFWPHLYGGLPTNLMEHISVYAARGRGRAQVQLLYLNMVALGLWTAMLKAGTLVGRVHRPPQSARLVLGMPFRGRSWSSLRWAAQQPLVSI
jgi:hypothetical protein